VRIVGIQKNGGKKLRTYSPKEKRPNSKKGGARERVKIHPTPEANGGKAKNLNSFQWRRNHSPEGKGSSPSRPVIKLPGTNKFTGRLGGRTASSGAKNDTGPNKWLKNDQSYQE